ncbi:uncharacterized protein LOC112093165 [Morus notabilis]|uniref:uncharacterized protein LOC112093165 n=1 Tax=Morus notabilis TaxID=981085 RepID=UPI000CED0FFE|nr:uncharacterized protein LOC112093165 [Morus notabilis]XP_024026863.1 uncharacterized protein LOC112093165 [Morus notabilis]
MQKRSSRIISETTFSISTSAAAATFQPPSLTFDDDVDHHHLDLPTYNPLSAVAKRQQSRLRSAQNAIHLIPLLLLLCAIVLWFFSNPGVAIAVPKLATSGLLLRLLKVIIKTCFSMISAVTRKQLSEAFSLNRSHEFSMYGDIKLASLYGDLKLKDLDRL